MIINNIIKYGYGDILTGFYNNQEGIWDKFIVHVTQIKPPQEIGESIRGKKCDVEKEICFKTTYEEICKLEKELLNINSTNSIIDFSDYILDFSNYNPKSVNVVLKGVMQAIETYLRPLAC